MIEIQIHKVETLKWFSPLGWLIKKSQGTPWHHYGVVWADADGVEQVSDAKFSGIRQVTMKQWTKEYESVQIVYIKLPISLDVWETWVQFKLGTSYAFLQLIGLLLISLRIIRTNPFGANKKRLVCHEYILIALARFLKLDIGDSDDYDFRKADMIINKMGEGNI